MTTLALLRRTFALRLLGWARIPLLASVRPVIEALDAERCVVRVPLRRWTRNHLGTMYFGAMAIGADCAGGLLAVERIRARKAGLTLVFKSFEARFLKRPEADVRFICEDGALIGELVEKVLATGERQTAPVRVRAAVPAPSGLETVAEFTLELSLKKTGKAVL